MKNHLIAILSLLTLIGVMSSTETRADWSSVPVGGGGFVTGMAISNDGTGIYFRTDVGGAYRWNSTTGSWNPLTDRMPNDLTNDGPGLGINSLAVDPANANKLYVATGAWTWTAPSGIYVTNDSSAAIPVWTVIDSTIRCNSNNGSIRSYGERLAVDPNNTTVLYYGTNNISGGGTGAKKYVLQSGSWVPSSLFSQALGDPSYGITFVACDAGGGSVNDGSRNVSQYIYLGVYSATVGNGGVYASSNGGLSWTKVTGVSMDKPARGKVAIDGTLYVTFSTGVAKVARGTTVATSIAPAVHGYVGLAVDPTNAGTVMVSTDSNSNYIYRSTSGGTGGSPWILVSRNAHAMEPDGTPSVTTTGTLDNISDLMINPTNANEVWTGDLLSVQRTENIGSTPSDWYCLQKNHEELVPLALKCPPTGAPLMIGSADVNGYAQGDIGSRSLAHFENPSFQPMGGGSTTSIDYCESTYSKDTVLARCFDTSTSGYGTGGVSLDDGESWMRFGQVATQTVYNNNSTPGWEEWDVTPYLARQKALGNNTVTLMVACDNPVPFLNDVVSFDSKEGVNPPQLVLNGGTPVGDTGDAYVYKNSTGTIYNTTSLQVSYYNDSNTRRSLLKFDLSSVTSVTSAKVRLYRNKSTYNAYFPTGIYGTAATAWTESTLTWANQPAPLSGSNFQSLASVPNADHGGRIAISATDPANMVWLGESGKVYYSKDRGVTWVNGTLGGSNLAVSALTEFAQQQNPLASDRVAAGTFYLLSATGTGTIYRSTDGGATWSSLTSLGTVGIQYKIAGIPGQSGFWIMTQTWNAAGAFKYWNGSSLVTVPNIPNVVDFAFGKGSGTNPAVYVRKADNTYWTSTDATAGSSATWTQLTGLSPLTIGPTGMEGDLQNFGRLYIITEGRGVMVTGGSSTRMFPAEDSYVRDGTYAAANQDGSTATTVDVKNFITPYNREGYFQFDFSSYDGSVGSATITLTPVSMGMAGIQNQVALVTDNDWDEDNITWYNKPASTTVLGIYTVTSGTPLVIPVTAQVQAAMSTGRISIRVTCTASDTNSLVSYASSENPNLTLQPVLKITP